MSVSQAGREVRSRGGARGAGAQVSCQFSIREAARRIWERQPPDAGAPQRETPSASSVSHWPSSTQPRFGKDSTAKGKKPKKSNLDK